MVHHICFGPILQKGRAAQYEPVQATTSIHLWVLYHSTRHGLLFVVVFAHILDGMQIWSSLKLLHVTRGWSPQTAFIASQRPKARCTNPPGFYDLVTQL